MSVNKVCSSGMKAVSMAAASIAIGEADVVGLGGLDIYGGVCNGGRSSREGWSL